jgi:hypothetical protein
VRTLIKIFCTKNTRTEPTSSIANPTCRAWYSQGSNRYGSQAAKPRRAFAFQGLCTELHNIYVVATAGRLFHLLTLQSRLIEHTLLRTVSDPLAHGSMSKAIALLLCMQCSCIWLLSFITNLCR